MRVEVIFFLAAILLCVQSHLYTNSNVDASLKQQCKDDTCVTDERPCFIPREKGILTRLDGVKVSNSNTFFPYVFPFTIQRSESVLDFCFAPLKPLSQQKYARTCSFDLYIYKQKGFYDTALTSITLRSFPAKLARLSSMYQMCQTYFKFGKLIVWSVFLTHSICCFSHNIEI